MKADRVRLDVLLVQQGYFSSREASRRAIMAGWVSRDGEVMDKPGTQVELTSTLQVYQPEHTYVSRGGLKLEQAIRVFGVSLTDRIVIDVGASTGGFTDCALQNGASRVYAVDVGYGQLAWRLRTDERVVVMERTNFRHTEPKVFQPRPDIGVMDVSFISIRLLLPKLMEVLDEPKEIVTLIKPQFEAGRENVGKGGIVRDPEVHRTVILERLLFADELGLTCHGLTYSPITGGDGNIEYLVHWKSKHHDPTHEQPTSEDGVSDYAKLTDETVSAAWAALKAT